MQRDSKRARGGKPRLSQPTLRTGASLLCTFFLSSTGLQAQTKRIVIPARFEKAEAPHSVFWALSPFASHHQLLIDEKHLLGAKGKVLRSITVRRNAGAPESYRAGQIMLDVWLSHSPKTAATASNSFAPNRGKDFIRLHTGAIALPPTARMVSKPAPWASPYQVTIPLSKGFLYRGGSLLVETQTRESPKSKKSPGAQSWWPIDGTRSLAEGRVLPLGQSCIPGMAGLPASAEASSLLPAKTAVFSLRGRSSAKLAFFALGSDAKRFGPLKLPFDLSPLGARGCSLYNNWLFLLVSPVESAAKTLTQLAVARVPLPNMTALVGAKLYGQWMLPSAAIRPFGLAFSNGVQATLGSKVPDGGITWLESTKLSSPRAERLPGRAPVLSFSFTAR